MRGCPGHTRQMIRCVTQGTVLEMRRDTGMVQRKAGDAAMLQGETDLRLNQASRRGSSRV